jgi:LPXTG-motif cell wall-anchored protein
MNAAVGQAKSQSALNKIALSRNIGFVILGVGVLALGVALIYTRRKR